MELELNLLALDQSSMPSVLNDVPDVCPRCHRGIHPKMIDGANLKERNIAQVVFRCTRQACQELFIGNYENSFSTKGGRLAFDLIDVAPKSAAAQYYPESVAVLSPTFVEISDQCNEAEVADLDQLVGIGLRKAVEFLIKDYAVSEHPGSADQIRAATLGQCIENYVTDANVKQCAKRAVWLGNDQTHYVRKWEAKDLTDLKNLVRLTVNWIENNILTKQYADDMPSA